MSRVAKIPVAVEQGVEVNLANHALTVKGPKGSLSMECHSEVEIINDDAGLTVSPRSGSRFARAMAGTTRSLISNMVVKERGFILRSVSPIPLFMSCRKMSV